MLPTLQWSECLERCNSVLDMLGSAAVGAAEAVSRGASSSTSNGSTADGSQQEQQAEQAEQAALARELPRAASALTAAMMDCAGALAAADGDKLSSSLQRELRA